MAAISDPIADFLTHLRNAAHAGHAELETSSSKLKVAIAKVLAEEGFIDGFEVVKQETAPEVKGWVKTMLKIGLRYTSKKKPVIRKIERVSRPGLRVYVRSTQIPRVLGGMGIVVLSTPKGVLSGETARRESLGGEILCRVS